VAYRKIKLICLCNGIAEKEILKLLKLGARDFEDIKKFTLASTSCGKCRREIESIVNQFFINKKNDAQQKINF
jgi:bacterioferritin-associated ferredoxin